MSWSDLSDKYKYIGQTHNIDSTAIHNLLEVVKKFIIRKELILYGGIAIDYALRLKGEKLYSDYNISDYDVYSSSHIKDAEEMVNELSRLGYKNISAIKAIHVQTMRVRWDHIAILDIGYVPKSVLNRIPILKYNGMPFVDPIFQYMDMHYSLCLPFSGAPMENITHRWDKDITRYNLMLKHYPPKLYLTHKVQLRNHKMKAPIANIGHKKLASGKTQSAKKIQIRPNYTTLELDLSKLPPLIV